MPGETRRLQIDVRPALQARFTRLLELGQLRSDRELLDTALTVLEWAVNQRAAGRVVGSVDEATGRFRELYTPYLEACHAAAVSSLRGDGRRPMRPTPIDLSTISR
jgi:hypothetical protein